MQMFKNRACAVAIGFFFILNILETKISTLERGMGVDAIIILIVLLVDLYMCTNDMHLRIDYRQL
jgi:hypothetical protein